MNKKELIEKKLRADEVAQGLIKLESDKIYDIANAIDDEICDLEKRLEKLKTVYEVYQGFNEMDVYTRHELGDMVCDYAIEIAKEGANGYRVLDYLYNASMDGSHKAIIEYARVVAYGLYGVSSSPDEAMNWLEKYADGGDAEACYCIAMLHNDFPREIEAQTAYSYCQKAASLGYSPAIRRLSQPFDMRTYTEKLVEKASQGNKKVYYELSQRHDLPDEERSRYLSLALEEEDMNAEFDHAMQLTKDGNADEARTYFEKAGVHGCSEAYMQLARLAIPEGGEPYYEYSKIDVTLTPLAYHKREFDYYLKAAELGHALAEVYVGIAYTQGYVANRDCERAYKCFAKAIELGDEYLAPYYLAECYENALGTEMDENAAVLYYTMSAEHGNIPSMLALARIYKEGLGSIEKDEQKSTRYFFMSGIGRN